MDISSLLAQDVIMLMWDIMSRRIPGGIQHKLMVLDLVLQLLVSILVEEWWLWDLQIFL